jgi:hypothetical protein
LQLEREGRSLVIQMNGATLDAALKDGTSYGFRRR